VIWFSPVNTSNSTSVHVTPYELYWNGKSDGGLNQLWAPRSIPSLKHSCKTCT